MNEQDRDAILALWDCLCRIEDAVGRPDFYCGTSAIEQIGFRVNLDSEIQELADAAMCVNPHPFCSWTEWTENVQSALDSAQSVLRPTRRLSPIDRVECVRTGMSRVRSFVLLTQNQMINEPPQPVTLVANAGQLSIRTPEEAEENKTKGDVSEALEVIFEPIRELMSKQNETLSALQEPFREMLKPYDEATRHWREAKIFEKLGDQKQMVAWLRDLIEEWHQVVVEESPTYCPLPAPAQPVVAEEYWVNHYDPTPLYAILVRAPFNLKIEELGRLTERQMEELYLRPYLESQKRRNQRKGKESGKGEPKKTGSSPDEATLLNPTEDTDDEKLDGPFDPYSFRWRGREWEFGRDVRRHYRLLLAMWPRFQRRTHATLDEVNRHIEDAGGSPVEQNVMRNYARELSELLSIHFNFPARLQVTKDFVRWVDLPDTPASS